MRGEKQRSTCTKRTAARFVGVCEVIVPIVGIRLDDEDAHCIDTARWVRTRDRGGCRTRTAAAEELRKHEERAAATTWLMKRSRWSRSPEFAENVLLKIKYHLLSVYVSSSLRFVLFRSVTKIPDQPTDQTSRSSSYTPYPVVVHTLGNVINELSQRSHTP